MKIIKILGIAAGLHALALILIFANPGCSYTKAAGDRRPAHFGGARRRLIRGRARRPRPNAVRYSPTRPNTAVASALEAQPVSDVTPATTYIVARGDNLWSIAKKNQLSKDRSGRGQPPEGGLGPARRPKAHHTREAGAGRAVAASDNAPEGAPAAPTVEKPSGEAVRHEVRPGETLGAIARQYGVKVGDIAEANNITDPKKIHPGQELVIPARSGSAQAGEGPKSAPSAQVNSKSAPAAVTPAADQDLDAGLKPANDAEVPVVKIDESNRGLAAEEPLSLAAMASGRSAESHRARAIANPVAAIVVCAIGLTFLGLTILFSASVSLKQDPYFYLDKQVVGVMVAGLLCFVASRINLDYRAGRLGVDRRAGPRPACPCPRSPPGGIGQGKPPLAGARRRAPSGLGVREAGDGVLPRPLPRPQPDEDRRPEARFSLSPGDHRRLRRPHHP